MIWDQSTLVENDHHLSLDSIGAEPSTGTIEGQRGHKTLQNDRAYGGLCVRISPVLLGGWNEVASDGLVWVIMRCESE
ncbi:hypothetical protein [Tunicatimonas pelagia]|uniref:hypothetical protein n=1 Tax=Tunicatimonas pelagia TaxID=931531 RepID=UPI0026669B83|nr:hypothetical protein [Tunicatimonas pelagia]WKN44906.1 hypothetical protein P0M28_08015 [Tunicatimonas pelagia]